MSARKLPVGMFAAFMAGSNWARRINWMLYARDRVSPAVTAERVQRARAANREMVRYLRYARKTVQP